MSVLGAVPSSADVALRFVRSRAPLTTDDISQGYGVGSFWTDQVTQKSYICTNTGQGIAVWKELATVVTPSPSLPFAEANLRAGFGTLTTANIPVGVSTYQLPNDGKDYLIDLGWVKRDRALKIYTRPGQRVHTKNVYIDVTIPVASGGTAYGRSGFGYRPVSNSAAPADHLSLTGCLITGTTLGDGLTFGDSTSSANNCLLLTCQKVRVESRSSRLGRQILGSDESVPTNPEHYDAFQTQGPVSRIQFGICTFMACDFAAPGHGGKGLMLNAYSATGNAYTVDMNQVNFVDDGPQSSRTGSYINQDYASIVLNMTDVYALKQGTGAYIWANNSSLFLMGSRDAVGQNWTSSGTAPNRIATFGGGMGWNGVIKEGRSPTGQDFCTRSMLGIA